MSNRPKRTKVEDIGAPGWMVTYSDLVTNLLCLFVLLFSFANIDKNKFEEIARSMRAAFSGQNGGVLEQEGGDSMISLTPFDNAIEESKAAGKNGSENDKITVSAAKADIEKLIEDMGLSENIKVIETKDVVIFRVDSLVLFDSGRAELKDSAKPVIEKMGLVLKQLNSEILIQGHADDRPINTTLYPSNWELSTKRATNVVKFLIQKCGIEETLLTATGNAEFRPIAPNDTEKNRQKNRRIDIVVSREE